MTRAPYDLDVRPILREGGEPFSAIMEAVTALDPGQPLRLFVTFKPIPLFQVMGARGFDASAREMEGGDWEVVFTPMDLSVSDDLPGDCTSPDWPQPDMELDLRDLDPPEPMVQVLECVEKLPAGRTMAACLPREPVFLMEELRARGHQWRGTRLSDDGYRIVIRSNVSTRDDT